MSAPEEFADFDRVYQELLLRAPESQIEPTLDRVARAVELMGHPERAYRVIHVTGTNGKTSTARLIERLLREHDLRTGRFTSPHLHVPTERISIDGNPIDESDFVRAWDDIAPFVEMVDTESAATGGPRMTFFEVLTLMGFAAFADAPVDVAVIEVGLGGEWDSTNVVQPDVTVITPIGLDHQSWLGSTPAAIARTKGGIIKPDSVSVQAQQSDPDAALVLSQRAAEVGSPLLREGLEYGVTSRTPAVGGQLISVQTLAGTYDDIFLSLYGAHQAQNAAAAIAAVEAFIGSAGDPLARELVEAAFADVSSPGRLEVVRNSPTLVVDAAHNPAGAEVLVEAVREAFQFTYTVGIFGALDDKDAETMLGILEPLFDEVVITQSTSPRAIPADVLAELARDVFGDDDRVHAAQRLDDAIQLAVDRAELSGQGMGGVVATGSVTIAGEVKLLLGRAG
ncbi:bifunctional folylpolyglutamate synthase/dihydrofolate synthase [Micrococcales bacterium 31B]|nr:bifunctional folylpolyglutamate synthase/dihydrofolate synthase [Micrococcales bacterium 31B]